MITEETITAKFRICPLHSPTVCYKDDELKTLIRNVWENENYGRITHEGGTWYLKLINIEWNCSGSGYDVTITAPIEIKIKNKLDEHIDKFCKLFDTVQKDFFKFKIFLQIVANAKKV